MSNNITRINNAKLRFYAKPVNNKETAESGFFENLKFKYRFTILIFLKGFYLQAEDLPVL